MRQSLSFSWSWHLSCFHFFQGLASYLQDSELDTHPADLNCTNPVWQALPKPWSLGHNQGYSWKKGMLCPISPPRKVAHSLPPHPLPERCLTVPTRLVDTKRSFASAREKMLHQVPIPEHSKNHSYLSCGQLRACKQTTREICIYAWPLLPMHKLQVQAWSCPGHPQPYAASPCSRSSSASARVPDSKISWRKLSRRRARFS